MLFNSHQPLQATLTPVTEEEWLVFRHFYRLEGPPLRASWFGETEGWRSQPGLCGECFADLSSEREQYKDATIHIRKVEAPGKEEEGEREEEVIPEVSFILENNVVDAFLHQFHSKGVKRFSFF